MGSVDMLEGSSSFEDAFEPEHATADARTNETIGKASPMVLRMPVDGSLEVWFMAHLQSMML